MSLTKIDDICALVVIDLQKGITSFPAAHPISEIIEKTARIARAFRERGLPVALVNVTGVRPTRTETGYGSFNPPADWADLVPDLGAQSGDIFITKQSWGAFIGTSLDEELRAKGATQIVLTGVSTSIGVESTARSAYDLGYNVTLVTDAMTDRELEHHRHSVETIFPRLGETTSSAELLKMLSEKDS